MHERVETIDMNIFEQISWKSKTNEHDCTTILQWNQLHLKHLSIMNSERDIFIVKILKSITIEPAVFLVSLSTTIENIANSQLIIDKTCEVDFNYNETVCDNLVTDFNHENEEIEEETA